MSKWKYLVEVQCEKENAVLMAPLCLKQEGLLVFIFNTVETRTD